MKLPRGLLRHSMTVEPFLGTSATGPVFGSPVVWRCYVEAVKRSARKPEGRTHPAAHKVIYDLDDAVTPDARVVVDGLGPVEVVEVRRFEGRLGAPDHTELIVQ